MFKFKITYILLISVILLISCKQTKYVPEGEYLLDSNQIVIKGADLDKYKVEDLLRQPANYKQLGVKWKLMAYNAIDSAKVAEKRKRKNKKILKKNKRRLERQERINERREERARENGEEYYIKKTVNLKDTVNPPMFFREWYKYKIGEPPVIFDSVPYKKTIDQMKAYLKKKGFYYGDVQGFVDYSEEKKVDVKYVLQTGPGYTIDSVKVQSSNKEILASYKEFERNRIVKPLVGDPFDADLLDDFRTEVAQHMKNDAFYGFQVSSITYIADTTPGDMKVNLLIDIGDRVIQPDNTSDQLIYRKYHKTKVSSVYFHIADTVHFEGNFQDTLDELGLPLYENQFITTIDTFIFTSKYRDDKSLIDSSRTAIMTYNGDLFVRAKVLESMNYLEKGTYYSEKELEKSYRALVRTNLFKMIKTEIVENPEDHSIEVHYYVMPGKRQIFGVKPRATNANGYLGVSASINYTNKNLFRGAERLTFTISGGFESQPPVFGINDDGEHVKVSERTFNIFEIGPSIKLEIPKLYPFDTREISKRIRPYTVISTAYNFQHRTDFSRSSYQMNYTWRFASSKLHVFHVGLPFASVVKVIKIDKQPEFDNKLNALNDLFLINAYSNQFIWQDWRFIYEYSNREKDDKRNNMIWYYRSTFDLAGNTLSLFQSYQDTTENGQYSFRGLGYSQFARLDNELVFSKPLGTGKSYHMRFIAGAGLPYGNTTTSLPYDYSFYSGGANDNRGWKARSLGPGAYKYYLDSNRTATQLGDIRLGGFAEYRFSINSLLKAAFFVDASNVWTINVDTNRVGSNFETHDFFKEISLATGVGLRLDLNYFVLRFDLGVPLTNPGLPPGERWIFMSKADRPKFIEAVTEVYGDDYEESIPRLFPINFHFGIGYPF